MINRTPAYGLPMPEENDNYSLAVVNEVTEKVDAALGSLNREKAPLDSPDFTGVPKIAGQEIATTKSGTWSFNIYGLTNSGT